ncbi:MAG: hypothetical protein ABJD53_04515 [Gammaproteobacteria bacterium]
MPLPNGAVYYVFSDAYEFPIDAAIKQIDTPAKYCRSKSAYIPIKSLLREAHIVCENHSAGRPRCIFWWCIHGFDRH